MKKEQILQQKHFSIGKSMLHNFLDKQDLVDFIQCYKKRTYNEELEWLSQKGGVEYIVESLKSDSDKGLLGDDFQQRLEHFGSNYRDPLKAKAFCKIFIETLDDFMLKLLMVCATFSITFDMVLAKDEDRSHAWIEGAAIFFAVFIVAVIGSFVDYKKEVQFVKSRTKSDELKTVRCLRNGVIETVHHNNLYVGDIIHFEYGMAIPVDGIVLQGVQLACDEAAMTGESDEMKKETYQKCLNQMKSNTQEQNQFVKISRAHELPSPVIMSGTSVSSGEGKMIVLVVGEISCIGEIINKLKIKDEKTPLQCKLELIAEDVGKLGTYVALLVIHVLLVRFFIEGFNERNVNLAGDQQIQEDGTFLSAQGAVLIYLKLWISYVIVGVAIIVVAVPEGLPLAVMISLAYSIEKMLKDNNDVKKLASCEIMGGANNICSDKTGTLTLNKMKVKRIWSGSDIQVPLAQDKDTGKMTKLNWKDLFSRSQVVPYLIEQNIACNTAAKAGATDLSMIDLLERTDTNTERIRAKHLKEGFIRFPFSSKRKRMSTIIENVQDAYPGYFKRLHVKGASEIVKGCCSHYIDEDGKVQPLDTKMSKKIDATINDYAKNALRTIALAYKDVMPGECGDNHSYPEKAEIKAIEESGLVLITIFGIMDIVRQEVPDAVKTIAAAGVTVRMVTGDNIVTAKAIAVICNILKPNELNDERCCMDGPTFYEKMGGLVMEHGEERIGDFEEFKSAMPFLKVLARSRPEDKYMLVTGLRHMGEVVAVTGDGTNDAPALRKADVGFAMGQTGTDVCKEAADILITDDNFSSIVKACMWGRNVYDNIQRFLQFQLTVNVGALIVTFVGSCITKETPLKPIQLLWVNLIMDSLGALALATETPKPDLLKRLPQNRNDYIVSRKMTKHILYQAIWQCFVLFLFLFDGENLIPESNVTLQYDRPTGFVYPGRLQDWDGTPLYSKFIEKHGPSRHYTFIFTAFVLMQIINMLCCRKVHDEWNIFDGIFTNPMFFILFFSMTAGQVIITQFGGYVFQVCLQGLDGTQWGIAIGIGFSTILINLLLKLLPDWLAPSLGDDRVFNAKYPKYATTLKEIDCLVNWIKFKTIIATLPPFPAAAAIAATPFFTSLTTFS